MARRRRAVRQQAVPRAAAIRQAGHRECTIPHRALGAIALVAALLVAILPVHASGLGRDGAERTVPEAYTVVADADADVADVPPSVSMSRPAVQELAATFRPGDLEGLPQSGSARPLLGWYRLAAAEQGVSADLLRALHDVESNAAPDGCLANAEGSGAIGPFQFKPSTFRQYGVDANNDGNRDICSFIDALFSAARYLRALGIGDLDDPQTGQALARYGTDPDRVLILARSYRDRAELKSPRRRRPQGVRKDGIPRLHRGRQRTGRHRWRTIASET